MLHQFIEANRDLIIAATRSKAALRPSPPEETADLQAGIPLFLGQLMEVLRQDQVEGLPVHQKAVPGQAGDRSAPDDAIGQGAARHGRELLARGFNVSQVVHGYGDVCQAITELAVERGEEISGEEFHSLNRTLDIAIAESVTEFDRLRDEGSDRHEAVRLGQVAHELRNKLHTALLSFNVLRSGRVGIAGSTGAVLGRSLASLGGLIDDLLAEVRLGAKAPRRDRVVMKDFLAEVAVAAGLFADQRDVRLAVEPPDPSLVVEGDPPTLASAVMNLLQNAIKYTPAGRQVTLRARRVGQRMALEVEDQCGGLAAPEGASLAEPFAEQRHGDRTGLGLGLSIAHQAAKANGGEISHRDLPGQGCTFVLELPAAPPLD